MTDARTILARVTDSTHRPRSFAAATVRDAFHRDRADGFDPSPIFWDVTNFDAGVLRLMVRDNRVLAVGQVGAVVPIRGAAWAVDVTDDLEALLG